VLLAFALKKKQRFDRLEHILNNLLSSGLTEHSPELLFLVSMYRLDLTKHFTDFSKTHLPMTQLGNFSFKLVLDKFAKNFTKKCNSDLLFRTATVSGSEIISLSVLVSQSEDYWFQCKSLFEPKLALLASNLVYLSPQFESAVFDWMMMCLQNDLDSFFVFLNHIHKDSFKSSSNKYFVYKYLYL
jgi:hypothetical protein